MVAVHMLQKATTFPFLLRISKTSLSDARGSTRFCKLLTSLSVLSGLVCETPISAAFSDAPSLLIVCTPVGGSHSRSIILISLDPFSLSGTWLIVWVQLNFADLVLLWKQIISSRLLCYWLQREVVHWGVTTIVTAYSTAFKLIAVAQRGLASQNTSFIVFHMLL